MRNSPYLFIFICLFIFLLKLISEGRSVLVIKITKGDNSIEVLNVLRDS